MIAIITIAVFTIAAVLTREGGKPNRETGRASAWARLEDTRFYS